MSKEAMKLALEALRLCTNAGMIPMYLETNETAIKALEEALAKQEQGASAAEGMKTLVEAAAEIIKSFDAGNTPYTFKFWDAYHHLQGSTTCDKPVAIVDANDDGYWAEILPDRSVKVGQLLYTTPQQRTWVGLTDEEIDKAWRSVDYTVPWEQHRIDIARAIEAKLKDKNT
jgi:hypothetical protein